MRIRSTDKKALHPGAWVRMRRNDDYKDDLGQVVDIDVDGARARVRLVPRLAAYLGEEDGTKRRVRPTPKLFDADELRAKGEDVGTGVRSSRGRQVYYYDNQEFEEGFLLRHLSVKGLKYGDGVQPTMAELERFKTGLGADADAELLAAASGAGSGALFRVGDYVQAAVGGGGGGGGGGGCEIARGWRRRGARSLSDAV